MKYKKIDKMLYESLNSNKPSEEVLNKAKAYMNIEQKIVKRKIAPRYIFATATCFVLLAVLSVFLPMFINGSHSDDMYYISSGELTCIEILSIKNSEEIENPLYYNMDVKDSFVYKNKETNGIVYFKENYIISDEYEASSLTLNIVTEKNLQYTIQDLDIYYNLSQTYLIDNLEINYRNYEDNLYYFSFNYNGNNYFISIVADNERTAKDLISLLLL
ncbi:MAG: hypothetical protein WCR54_05510 [Clostridia bacterium]